MKMLKDLVRKRLIAAADEICELFAEMIASYEDQLRHARQGTELRFRHPKALFKTQTVLRVQDVQHQADSSKSEEEFRQPRYHNEKGEHRQPLHIKEEEEETVVSNFPLTGVCDGSDDNIDKSSDWSQIGEHFEGLPSHNLLAPLSDNDDTGGPLRSEASRGIDDERLKYYEEDALTLTNRDSSQKHKKGFICSICGRVLGSNAVLVIHMRKHTGEKPFVCTVCGKAFIQKSHLASHMITHTGEKPFSCSFCGLSFSYKCNRNKHMLKHVKS